MFLSVIVPVYNVEKYLAKCIDSIIGQNFESFEILLINDGSTDSSQFICEQYSSKDSRIKIINQENQGLSEARNTGIYHAKGTYLWFVDGDDWIAENAVNTLYEVSKTLDYDLISFSFTEYFEDLGTFSDPRNVQEIHAKTGVDFIKQSKFFFTSACVNIYRNEFLKINRFSFKKNQIHEDDYFNLSCFGKVKNVVKIPLSLYFYRRRVNSLTTDLSATAIEKRILSYVSLINLCGVIEDLDSFFLKSKSDEYKIILLNLLDEYTTKSKSLKKKVYMIRYVKKNVKKIIVSKNDFAFSIVSYLKKRSFNFGWFFYLIIGELGLFYQFILKKTDVKS